MRRPVRGVHIFLEVVGGISILAGLAWLALYALSYPFRHFSGGNCDDAEQKFITSPDGKHTIKSFHRACGAGNERPYSFYLVYLSTGNPNPGYEFTQVVEIRDVAIGQTTAAWDGPDQLSVTYPSSATVGEAYAKTFGVRIVLHPPLSENTMKTPKTSY
jgi:hypothetical protein